MTTETAKIGNEIIANLRWYDKFKAEQQKHSMAKLFGSYDNPLSGNRYLHIHSQIPWYSV